MNDHVLSASPTLDDQTRACLRLWAAVMANGIRSAATGISSHDMDHEAVKWLYDDGDNKVQGGRNVRDVPGSFTWICDLMGFDADQARSKVRMSVRKLSRQAKALEAVDVPVKS